jgi:hypothetical protein
MILTKRSCHPVFYASDDVIGWLNGRASVFGTEGYGFESRVGLTTFNSFTFNHDLTIFVLIWLNFDTR